MWVITEVIEPRGQAYIGIPHNAKDVVSRMTCPDMGDAASAGASLWGAVVLQSQWQGLWDSGRQWELWVPQCFTVGAPITSIDQTFATISGYSK